MLSMPWPIFSPLLLFTRHVPSIPVVDSLQKGTIGSRLQVQIPSELFKPEGYEHQEALFGIPPYGGAIAERLLHGGLMTKGVSKTWTLCDDKEAAMFAPPESNTPYILMIDRGNCTFANKVRRAQHLGASGVIIADNNCLCSDTDCIMDEGMVCEQVEPIMADDGSGTDIAIPSFLMKKPDASMLKNRLESGFLVQVEMAWSMPDPDDRVEWSLWTSVIDPSAVAFKRDFKDIVVDLDKYTQFEPFYVVYDGEAYGCTKTQTKCGNLCTNGGRYCMTDPDFDTKKGISGADVIGESLRQKCVWNYYGGPQADIKDQGIGEKWWSYVSEFSAQCGTERFTDSSCVSAAMVSAGIDEKRINQCMDSSGGVVDDVENTILNQELKEKSTKSIVVIPTVYVNNVAERGGINTASVLSTICAGFADGTEPELCNCAGQTSSNLVKDCVAQWKDGGSIWGGGSSGGGMSMGSTLFILLVVVGSMTAAGFVYWKRTQDQMRDQARVRGILAEYMPLEDIDGPASSARVPFMGP
ncbi:unnamed protein product, partial [Choristocarpus tenellus]